jgi:hypothetical protein
MAKSSGGKRKSAAYRLVNEETGHHYVIRLGREGYDKLRDKEVIKFNPKLKKHAPYKVRKIKNNK